MKYLIDRTSLGLGDDKPCEEAIRIEVQNWYTRIVTEEEFNKSFSDREGLWRSNRNI